MELAREQAVEWERLIGRSIESAVDDTVLDEDSMLDWWGICHD